MYSIISESKDGLGKMEKLENKVGSGLFIFYFFGVLIVIMKGNRQVLDLVHN
jgi:hypothetical protein